MLSALFLCLQPELTILIYLLMMWSFNDRCNECKSLPK